MNHSIHTPNKIYVYYRVSTHYQADDNRNGLDSQTDTCDRYALKIFKTPERNIDYYCDIGSTYNNKCVLKEQNKLIRDLNYNSVVLVYDVSRLGRNILQVFKLLKKIKENHSYVISINDNVCYGKSRLLDKKFLYKVIESEEKSDLKSSRMSGYISMIRSLGGYIGRSPYGYNIAKINSVPKLVKNTEEQNVIKQIKKFKKSRKSYEEMAVILNRTGNKRGSIWSASNVRSVQLKARKTTKSSSSLEVSMSSLQV